MSLSSQLILFLGVALIYIGFAFAWGWYKGRQEHDEPQTDPATAVDGTGGER